MVTDSALSSSSQQSPQVTGVSTDRPSGPAEILDNGRYGALVPVEDEDSLAAAIL